jgi:hypothetical protein
MGKEGQAAPDWREWRRKRAWQLSLEGWGVRAIANALGAGCRSSLRAKSRCFFIRLG